MKDESLKARVQVFDPKQKFSVTERSLPHWSQAGTIAFLTWRRWDSIPREVLERWLNEREAWLQRHAIEVGSVGAALREPKASRGARGLQRRPRSRLDWRERVERLPASVRAEFQSLVSDRWMSISMRVTASAS